MTGSFVRIPFIAVLGSLVAAGVSAQVRGTVVDPAGHPLADAVVDLWSPTARVGRVVTGPEGLFKFNVATGSRIVVRRIGSPALVQSLDPADSVLTLHLASAPLQLASIDVVGQCGTREDKAARRRWEMASSWYNPLPDSLWLKATYKGEASRVPVEEAERADIDSTGYGIAGYRGSAIRFGDSIVARSGYPAPDPERDEVFSNSLTPAELQQLVDPFFGRRVRFTTIDDQRIRFCPRDRRLPWVEGEFKLADDGSLLWARWRYGAKRPGWETGGVATFLAPSEDRSMPLLTSTFLVWQERTGRLVARWAIEYSAWQVSHQEPRDWHP